MHLQNLVKLFGDGTQIRDFVYSKDVAEMILNIISRKLDGIFNIGTGKGITIRELANKIKKLSNSKSKLIFQKKKYSGDKKNSRH